MTWDEAVYSTSTENSTAAENGLLPQDMERVKAVKERYETELMSQQDVLGVGVGRDESGEGAMWSTLTGRLGALMLCLIEWTT